MNSISLIEFFLVASIVIIQTVLAFRTYKQIKVIGSIIPDLNRFSLKKYNIPIQELMDSDPKEILHNLASYEKKQKQDYEPDYFDNKDGHLDVLNDLEDEVDVNNDDNQNQISLINPDGLVNDVFKEILFAINVYLLRNKGAAADFNLIKDVVERNLDMEEEDISHSVTVPLYLGLMGTMVGIVFGLLNLFLVSDANTDFDITGFLGGVSIAMFASFWGLFCTVLNSSFNFKKARRRLERAKNVFYTFLQTELLPVLNLSVSSSIYTLHTNLVKFNDNFSLNLSSLSSMLNKNHDALIAQERILTALDNIDIADFAKANVKVLKELKMGTEQLEKFSNYLNSLNHLSAKTSSLSISFEDLLNRTNNFQNLAEKLDSRIEESNNLVRFLTNHFSLLDQRGKLIEESVVKIDDVIIKSLGVLEEHTQTKIDAIKQITIKEEDLMTQTFAENRSHISKLSLLDDMKRSIDDFKKVSLANVESIKKDVESLKSTIEMSNAVLKEISNSSLIQKTQNVAKSIKKLFSGK